ncbi:MAG: aromatic amino acid lyase [Bifidobacteriaceae bacterium]|nr:aromatic amino acid lyase [Bifidobacteriaceae bacterium]
MSGPDKGPVGIGGQLRPSDVARVADGAPVRVDPGVRERLAAERAVVEEALAGGVPVYGLNRGLGPLRDSQIPDDREEEFQRFVIASHAAAIGPPLPKRMARAAILVRLATLSRGGSGASLGLFNALVELLNRDVIPVIPADGTISAGDLSQLAAIGQVLLGEGSAWIPGPDSPLPGAQALRARGLAPLRLGPKDALALVAANAVSIAAAALLQQRAARAALGADLVAALSFDALGANLSPLDSAALAARPLQGQQTSGRRLRAALAGGDLAQGKRPPSSIQDPISLRTVPQVHGALLDQLAALETAVAAELASSPDNPYLDASRRAFVSNGNFSIVGLAISLEALRVAFAHVAILAERRVALQIKRLRSGVELAAQMAAAAAPGTFSVPFILAQTASAEAARITQAAAPVTLAGSPVGDGVEDHSSLAYSAAQLADHALDHLERLLAIEALVAVGVIASEQGSPVLGGQVGALAEETRAAADASASTAETVDRVVAALRTAAQNAADDDQ